jgi:hypothetical protein
MGMMKRKTFDGATGNKTAESWNTATTNRLLYHERLYIMAHYQVD